MSKFETWFKTSGWPEKHKIACQDAWECGTGSEEHIHDLEVQVVRLEKENAELREGKKKLCESMLNVIGCVRLVSEDAYKCIKQDFIKKLKEQGE